MPGALPKGCNERPRRRGFTLVELLIVVVIIGILAAIAVPRFVNTKERAYRVAMMADLRNLFTAQESYFADHITYAASTSSLNVIITTGVTVTIGAATGTGWNATASHNGTTKTCGIYYGSASPPISGANEGSPKCQ